MNSYQFKEGYKQTEIGVIPEDWIVHTIKETVTLINGCAFKPKDWKTQGLPIIRIQNLNDPAASYNYCDVEVDEKYYVSFGDILFAWSGTKESSFGARVWRGGKAILNQHIFRVIPNPEKLTPHYTFLTLKRFQEDIEKKSHGFKSSFVHVKKSDLENIKLAIPPLHEQRALAQVLSDVDALIAALDKLIAKKRHLKTATMQQLLTGKKRLPGFGDGQGYKESAIGLIPEDWDVSSLSELCSAIVDGTHYTPSYVVDGIPFYSVENVTANDFENIKYISNEEHLRLIKRCKPEKGNLLLTRIGSLGATKLIDWDIDASIYVSLALLKLNEKAYPNYVYVYSKSEQFLKDVEKRSLTNATPQKINMGDVGNVPILIPLNQKEQNAIATVLSDMDAEIAALESRLAKTQALKQGMMQELLIGRIRLKIET